MSHDLRREFVRKLFHCLSLVYLGAYLAWGREVFLYALTAWIFLEGGLEVVRLRVSAVNKFLLELFAGLHRPAEEKKISGVLWASVGSWIAVYFFGHEKDWATAALLCLCFGDIAAALVGRAWGRTKVRWGEREKSLEGSIACFAACWVSCAAAGVGAGPSAAAAAAATIAEFLPLPVDDNLWLPVAAAWAASLAG